MLKNKSFSKILSFFLVICIMLSLSVSLISADQPDNTIKIESKTIVEVINESTGEINSITLYTTPETEITTETFNDLKEGYSVKSITKETVSEEEEATIGILWVETAFDIGNFILSVSEFNQNPSFWNGFWVVADGASMVLPGIPAVSGVKRMIQSSSKLADALKFDVKSYKRMSTATGRERHHIFEKRFASVFDNNTDDMLCISLTTSDHRLFTAKMKEKIGYLTDVYYFILGSDEIKRLHTEAYYELWQDTDDSLWEFLYKFSQSGQTTPNAN